MVASAKLPGRQGFTGKLNAIWIDCVGRCCKDDENAPGGFYLGGGTGAPNLIMQEAGMENMFADREGSWVCVSAADILAKNPDVVVVVHASWDTAMEKVELLYNHSEFCLTDFVREAKFVTIPFSASTLSPRNGKAALDLASSGIHVNNGETSRRRTYVDFESGVKVFDLDVLQRHTAGLLCPLDRNAVQYGLRPTSEPSEQPSAALPATALTNAPSEMPTRRSTAPVAQTSDTAQPSLSTTLSHYLLVSAAVLYFFA